MSSKYLVVIEKGSRNYSTYSPDFPGCTATGKTVEQTLSNFKTALEFHVEGMIENGERIPPPKNLRFYAEELVDFTADDIIINVVVEGAELALA